MRRVVQQPSEALLDLLDELLQHRMVYVRETATAETRFLMLETIGAYAAEQLAASGEQAAAAKSLTHLGEVLIRLGELATARRTFAEALSLAEAADAPVFVAEIIHWIACLAAADHQGVRAAQLFGAAEALYERYGIDLHTEDYALTVNQVRATRDQLGSADFAAAWHAGSLLGDEDLTALARAILGQPHQPTVAADPAVQQGPALSEPLSDREVEVLVLLASGLSNQALAERLVISVNTVQTHLIAGRLWQVTRRSALSASPGSRPDAQPRQ